MITHSILKFKPSQFYPPVQRAWQPTVVYPVPKEMGKLEFAMFLQKNGYVVGDFVVGKVFEPPYTCNTVHRITEVTEIHRFVSRFDHTGAPMCYTIEPLKGTPFSTSLANFKLVETALLPKEWLVA